MTRLLPLLLALLAVALSGAIKLELQPDTMPDSLESSVPMSTRPARQASAPGSTALRPDPREGWVQAILARPLFAPDRRPPAAAASAPGAPPPILPRLAGILLDGPRRSVIFAGPGDARPSVIPEGGNLAGFKVQTIEAGQVTIMGPDGPHVLRPSFDPRPPTPATPGIPGLPNLSSLTAFPGLSTPPGQPAFPGLPSPPIAR